MSSILEKVSEQVDEIERKQSEAEARAATSAKWWGGIVAFGTAATVEVARALASVFHR